MGRQADGTAEFFARCSEHFLGMRAILDVPGEKYAHSPVHWDRLSEQELHRGWDADLHFFFSRRKQFSHFGVQRLSRKLISKGKQLITLTIPVSLVQEKSSKGIESLEP